MQHEIKKWDEAQLGKMNFENVCRLYSADKSISLSKEPPFIRAFYAVVDNENKYAVRWNAYEPGADFSGESFVDRDYLILRGSCQITVNGKIVELSRSDCFKFPKGRYRLKVVSDERFEDIAVFKLPDDFQIPRQD